MLNVDNGSFALGRLRGEVDRLFSDLFQPMQSTASSGWQESRGPFFNVWEDASCFYLEAELPGYRLEDLEILVIKNELSLKGKRMDSAKDGTIFHRRERSAGAIGRTIRLPAEVEAGKVEASLRNGVLSVKLPKAAEAKPRKIPVLSK